MLNTQSDEVRTRLYQRYTTQETALAGADVRTVLARRAPYLRRLIARWIPGNRESRIVDLGCGYGAVLYFLREAGYGRVSGVDTSSGQTATARDLGIEDIELADLNCFLKKAQPDSYDVVLAMDVLEHLTKSELLETGDRVHEVLAPGGRLIIHAPNGEAIFSGSIVYGDLTHQSAFTRASIGQFAAACGFEVVAVEEDVPAVHGPLSALRFLLWKLGTFLFRVLTTVETGGGFRTTILSRNLLAILRKPAQQQRIEI